MKILHFCLLAFFLLLVPFLSAASGVDLTGQSRTYLPYKETADSTRLLPLYEYLNFRVEDPDPGLASFNVGGWYRHDLVNESPAGNYNDDLQYAYLSFKKGTGNGTLDLGRILVHEGVASEQIDGVHAAPT
jgi:hypothetical protein